MTDCLGEVLLGLDQSAKLPRGDPVLGRVALLPPPAKALDPGQLAIELGIGSSRLLRLAEDPCPLHRGHRD